MYDLGSLSRLLSDSGFCDVEPCEPGQGKVPDASKLDNRPDETLYVEAQKA